MFYTLLLATWFLPALSDDLKMVIVFGKVTDSAQAAGTSMSKDDCFDDCFDECFSATDCILAYFNSDQTCLLYNYTTTQTLTVTETNREDDCYVAFKTSMSSDSCPASPDLINLTVTVLDDTYHWTRTESGWNLKKCIDDWKLFHRKNSVSVCMQSFNMTRGSTIEQAKEFCVTKGHVLTGLATIEECNWAYGKLEKQTNAMNFGFWIDGKRNCPEGVKCNNFVLSDGYTNENNIEQETYASGNFYASYQYRNDKEDCLVVTLSSYHLNVTLNDVSCDGSVYANAIGVVCGYRFN